uniref:Uncharacterized protein n=1 Tax=Cacopsylla melanoneura TaxID=428564 RepID=A0A8D9E061_9HEMI
MSRFYCNQEFIKPSYWSRISTKCLPECCVITVNTPSISKMNLPLYTLLFYLTCHASKATDLSVELNKAYTSKQSKPISNVNMILDRFCNFLQLKTSTVKTAMPTKYFLFKFHSMSTEFPVHMKYHKQLQTNLESAVINLTQKGFHADYFARNLLVKNKTEVHLGFLKALITQVKTLFPADYFPD